MSLSWKEKKKLDFFSHKDILLTWERSLNPEATNKIVIFGIVALKEVNVL